MRGDKESSFNSVTNYGGVWRKVPEIEAWGVEEGCRKVRLGVWWKGAGKRGLECGGRVPESEAWSVEEGCRKARLGVWRKGAEKRGLECGGSVPESKP